MKQHLYPQIREFGKTGEALMAISTEAKAYKKASLKINVDQIWYDPETAEARAKSITSTSDDLWRGQIMLTWGQYKGKKFKWLIENDMGWACRLLAEYLRKGDKNPLQHWQKEQLLQWVDAFPPTKLILDKKRAMVRINIILLHQCVYVENVKFQKKKKS